MFIAKLDNSGNIIWIKDFTYLIQDSEDILTLLYGIAQYSDDLLFTEITSPYGIYIPSEETVNGEEIIIESDSEVDYDMYIMKINKSGKTMWLADADVLAENIDIKVEGNDYYILDYDNYTIHKFTETKEVKNVVEDEVITYTITVTNTGDLAKGITVNVAEGQTVTLSFEVLVHYMDINTTISNIAYVDDYATNRVDTPYINPEAQIGCNIVKNGTSTITNADQLVEYEITYTASIKDYIGNAEVVIVDTLPYEIDETKSDLAGGTYDARAKTITWTETINNINTIKNGDNQINITKKISVVYKGLNSKIPSLTNKVQGSLNLLDTEETNTVETEFESKVNILSRVIVRYVNEFGYEIGTMEIIEGPEGTTYVTHFKDIENKLPMYTKGLKEK